MIKFFANHPLAITPLTPVHIGCGEDFEPTNYVIDDGTLFHFDPAAVPLSSDERRKLLDAIASGGDQAVRRIQKFFFDRKEAFIGGTRNIVSVTDGIAEQYELRIGQIAQSEGGNQRVVNNLEIERTANHPHTGLAYIPGSSIKGSMRTAWLDQINGGSPREGEERANSLEKRLLGGAFESDPFRLVRLADAAGQEVASQVVFSTNHKKRQVFDKSGQEFFGKGPAVRREVIAPAQYRKLTAEIRFDNLGNLAPDLITPRLDKRIPAPAIASMAAACNRFYLRRLQMELSVLESRRLVSDRWLERFRALITGLQERLDSGDAMLLRIGRHSGAESVTIEGVRSIRIMGGRGEAAAWSSESTTLWLAAEREDDRTGMQPFGWVLVEPGGARDSPALQLWCDAQSTRSLAPAWSRVTAAKAHLASEISQRNERAATELARAIAEEQAKVEREARIAALSAEGKLVEALRRRLDAHYGPKQPVSGALYAETKRLVDSAIAGAWADSDKVALANLVADLGFAKISFGGKEKEIKRSVRRLRGEE